MAQVAVRDVHDESACTLAGVTTRRIRRAGERPTFVLLHGWADSADCWRAACEALPGAATVAVDLPGHGEAGPIGAAPYLERLDRFAREAAEGTEGDVVVAGYSLGALLALRLGCDPPANLRGVIALAPPGLAPHWWTRPTTLLAPLGRLALGLPLPVPAALVHALTRQGYRQLSFAHPERLTPEVWRRYTDYWGDGGRVRGQLRALLDLALELGETFDPARLRVPVMAVWGADDRLVPPAAARGLAGAGVPVRVELIHDCGHIAPVDAPEAVAERMLSFRAGLTRGVA